MLRETDAAALSPFGAHAAGLLTRTSRAIRESESLQSVTGVLDQGIAALASMVPLVVLGRLAGSGELGLFALAVSAALFATLILQSLFLSGYPIIRAEYGASDGRQTFQTLLFGFCAVAVLAPLSLYGLLLAGVLGETSQLFPFAILAFVTTTSLRGYLRALSLVRRDLLAILALDALYLVVVAVALVLVIERPALSATTLLVLLSATNALFVVAWCWQYAASIEMSFTGAFPFLTRSARFGRWALAGVVCGATPYYLMPWILAVGSGSRAAGLYAAGSTVAGFVNHVLLGLLRGVEARTAEAFRQGPAQLHGAVVKTCWIVLPPLVALVLLVFLLADVLGGLVLPDQGAEAGAVARLLGLALLVGSIRVIVGNALWAMSLPQATVRADIFRGAASVALGIAGAHLAGPIGCAAAVLVGDLGSTLLLVARYRAESRGGGR